jgi:hypothetical protein
MTIRRLTVLFLVLGTVSVSACRVLARDAQGGGFADRGIVGKWYDNAEFQGEPAFERKDVRILFDWGSDRRPGGVNGNDFDKLDVDDFSVRWRGTLIPRYSETYRFYLTVDDGARMAIRPHGGSWTPLIDPVVQNDEADQAGYESRTSGPLATRGGGYITGGQMYRSAGAALDLDKIPSDFLAGDQEILCRMFVFCPGNSAGVASLDDLKVGDSLTAVR